MSVSTSPDPKERKEWMETLWRLSKILFSYDTRPRLMDEIIRSLDGVFTHIDDLLIGNIDIAKHQQQLTDLLKRLV
ncbi:unnamed protein product [Protopolystoma xenopodis]|uniref:PH domain-containing protein n=1 Tax=Protopolystoma xenopodis TaxID=117903 RepID=A0A448WBS7_9PLAT|nr:unnamed protein product [Protopolystoma xenopodis]